MKAKKEIKERGRGSISGRLEIAPATIALKSGSFGTSAEKDAANSVSDYPNKTGWHQEPRAACRNNFKVAFVTIRARDVQGWPMLAALGALFGAAGKRGLADFTLDKIQRCSKLRQSHQFSPFLLPFDMHETFIMDALFNNPLPQRIGRDWAIFLAVRPQDSIHGADYSTASLKNQFPFL
jgi:hypothetical protein